MPTRKSVERQLEGVRDFADPSIALEQYQTSAGVAAHLCHRAAMNGDLARLVVDLGTGTGMLAIAARLYGTDSVVGVDIDRSALDRARVNEIDVTGERSIDWLHADATSPPLCIDGATVIANPPFGAQQGQRHADRAFLETARQLGSVSYTCHNAGSQSFIESFVADAGGSVTQAFRTDLVIPHQFSFHDAETQAIPIEIFRIEWSH
ncbi:MAG: METTL5 family protein [Natrialbaceae archaeon]|nr:METTL5 family protein [Natrialbaceae archaeon]